MNKDEIFLVKGVLKSCHLFYKENSKYYIQNSPLSKRNSNKAQYALYDVLKIYSEKLAKITKYDVPNQIDTKNTRKNSLEEIQGKFVKTYFSTGTLLSEQKIEIMQSFLKKTYDQSLIVIEICYENGMISTMGYVMEDFRKIFPMYR